MKVLFSILILVLTQSIFSQDCFPESHLRFSHKAKSVDGLTEFSAKRLIENFQKVMNEEVQKQMNKKLIVELDWKNDRVNASATRDDDNNPVIKMLGGMARHPRLTKDGFLMILCHELGHHLGGAPKKLRGRSTKRSWSSAEGQADYYATSKCFPKIIAGNVETSNPFKSLEGDQSKAASDKCNMDEVCLRAASAALSVTEVFASIKGAQQFPMLEKKDRSEVYMTLYKHPKSQCRLDTMVAGIFCRKYLDEPFDNIDPLIGACTKSEGDKIDQDGMRPRCWYFPEELFK